METKNIYKALAAINKGIGVIKKTSKNHQQGFMYRGIDDVMNELHGLFAENEVFILPEFLDTETVERQTKNGSALFYVKAKIRFVFQASDGSNVECTIVGEAMDSGDKATNKAMSIALKYALLQMFLIPTAEDKDPDANTPPEIKPKQTPKPVNQELEDALFAVTIAEDVEGLKKIWESYEKLHNNKAFSEAVKQAKLQFAKNAMK